MALTNHIVPDSPTNNFATMNSITPSSGTISDGNLKVLSSGSLSECTFQVDSGKWYFEYLSTNEASPNENEILWYNRTSSSFAAGYLSTSGDKDVDSVISSFGATWGVDDIIGSFIDCSTKTVTFYKNGVSQGSLTFTSTFPVTPAQVRRGGTGTVGGYLNFGQDPTFAGSKSPTTTYTDANGIGAFYYEPPTDALALCTANLPDFTPDVDDDTPQDYFKAVTYTGQTNAGAYNNGNVNVGFEPGIVWIKNRDQGDGHRLFTVATGVNNYFQTDNRTTGTSSTSLTSFNQTTNGVGFSIGNDATVNTSGEKYIAWCWKTGSSTSNTDGSIPSTVWKNENSGVSVVQYTGDGSASATVGHGLNTIDGFFSINNSSGLVFFPQILGDANLYIHNADSAVNDTGSNGSFGNFTNLTFGFRNGSSNNVNNVNASGTTYTVLVFESVAGYSAFGSFNGNGSADGPFVYTGFKPAYVLYKKSSSSSYPTAWNCFDNQRVGYNPSNNKLYLDIADYDRTGEYMDLLSNGFKLRTAGNYDNEDGKTYIYMAFAEQPFKYANAR